MVDGESNDDDALGEKKKTRIISDTTCKNCANGFFNEGLHLLLINQPVGIKKISRVERWLTTGYFHYCPSYQIYQLSLKFSCNKHDWKENHSQTERQTNHFNDSLSAFVNMLVLYGFVLPQHLSKNVRFHSQNKLGFWRQTQWLKFTVGRILINTVAKTKTNNVGSYHC